MLIGCYYRCPIPIEPGDQEHPRFFVLGQVTGHDEISDIVHVKLHDLLGTYSFYYEILDQENFYAPSITRCAAIPGGVVRGEWGRGTILSKVEPSSDDQPYWYNVMLPNGTCVKACETDLQIECSQMNYPPELQLRSYEFQHPTWFINRLKVSRNVHLVNNAVYGFKILAGCRAFLLLHQLNTVARCFETRPIRYMLADEVGLGKTVEACSILKILASETRDLKVLIIAPGALIGQWKNELHYKFNLSAEIGTTRASICLLPMEDMGGADRILQHSWDMAVIDETHRLLADDVLYEGVQSLSRKVTHIILLSATPIQDRNEEYRRLLALLSPEQYADMPPERFKWLVKKQKSIQQTVNQQLNRLDHYEDYGELIIEKLQSIAETLGDKALSKLVDGIDPAAEDGGKELVTQALSFICENYRVERKVIRNRRQLIKEKMARRALQELPYQPLTANETYNETGAIQNTLSYLSENGDGSEEFVLNTALPLLGALFSSPWAFEDALDTLGIEDIGLRNSARSWKMQAAQEHALVDQALDEDPDLIKGRLMTAMNYIDQETDILSDENCKIVVFTGYNATLNEFLQLFNNRYQSQGIHAVGFGRHMTRDALDDSVYAFQNDPACRMIVCDETGGEGRNFQNAAMLIHLDIPSSANALEQRIGRLDRLGRDPDMDVLSVVLYAEGTIEEQLFQIWNAEEGLNLFRQSLSGLEIITGELNKLIVEALADDVYNGLANAFDDIVEQAEEMRDSVQDEQLFDFGTTLYRPLSKGVDNVLSLYAGEASNLFAEAMLGWGAQAGLEAEPPTEDGLIEFRERRFSTRAACQSLFVPPDWDRYQNSSMMRREGKILGSFDRKTAALREDILFFAPGDAVYDSIILNAISCSRGRCAAIEIGGNFHYDGLVFIFNVEVPVDKLIEEGIDLQALSRFRMFLPLEQIVIPIALTQKSAEVPQKQVIQAVMAASERNTSHLGRRGAGRMDISPLERFILKTPPNNWEPLVDSCVKEARKQAYRQMEENSDFASIKKEMTRIINGYRSEALFFERDPGIAEETRKIFSATLKAMKMAKPVLDAACFVRVRTHG